MIEGLEVNLQEHMNFYDQYLQDIISYEAVRTKIMALMTRQGSRTIPRDQLTKISNQVTIRAEALEIMPILKDQGYQMCLISSGIDIFVENIAARLGVNFWYANAVLKFDIHDNWVDFQYERGEANLKVQQLSQFLNHCNLSYDDCCGWRWSSGCCLI